MILSLNKKKHIVCDIRKIATKAISVIVANLAGIGVNEVTQLREDVRKTGSHMYVVRNTLLRRIVEGTEFLCLKDILVGQNIVVFSFKIPSEVIRIFIRFSKRNETFKIKGAVFEGKFFDTSQINFLSYLPTYQESLKNLILVIKMSSVGNLLRVLHFLSIPR